MAETIRNINSVSGTVFDLTHAMSLPSDDCNVLLVSSRTLFFIQLFGTGEIGYLARYASEFVSGNRYVLAQSETDYDNINDIVNNYQLEVIDMSCNLVEAIQELTQAVINLNTANCEGCGSVPDEAPLEDPPVGPGTPWPTQEDYNTYKCEASNWLQDGLEDVLSKLSQYDAVFWTTAGVAAIVTIIVGVLVASPLAGLITTIAGGVITIALALIAGQTINMSAMLTILQNNRQQLICQLYEGFSADDSRDRYLNWIDANTVMNPAELGLLQLFMLDIVMNKLYSEYSPIIGYTVTTSCTGCAAPAGCGVSFILFGDDTPRGTGDLTKNGLTRTLASEPHPSNGFHYVSFKVGEPPSQSSYFTDCSAMPANCAFGPDEDFHFEFLSASVGTLVQSTATRCLDGVRSLVYNNSGNPAAGSWNVSWVDLIHDAPFTVDVILSD